MQKSNAPTIITVPFASGAGSGYRNTLPIPSQIPVTPGLASWTDGFPPLTMTQPGAGGIPPYGQDMNGLGYALSTINQWTQLGYVAAFSSSVSTSIGGYPQGACLGMLNGLGYWLNQADNNTTNPDATGAANWIAILSNAGKSTIAVASGTVIPDPSVLGAPLLVLSGTLTANVMLVLPLTPGAGWEIYNATTGAFTVTVQGATGAGVGVSQGGLTGVRTDGVNYYTAALPGGPYLPLTGTAAAATKLATPRNIAMTGPVTWSVNFDGSASVTAASTIANGAIGLAQMANLTANTLLGNPTGTAATPTAIPLVNGIIFTGGSLGLGSITTTGAAINGNAVITTAGTNGLQVISSSTNSASLQFVNTASGGRTYATGSFNATSSGVTGYGVYDGTASKFAFFVDSNNQFVNNGKIRAAVTSGPAYDANIADNSWAFIINDVNDLNTRGGLWRSSSTPGVALINALAGFKGLWAYDTGTFGCDGNFTAGGSLNGSSISTSGVAALGNTTITGTLSASGSAALGATTINGNLQVNGNIQNTGTLNFGTSDATLKDLGEPIEPTPFHRLPYYAYTRKDTGARGWGPTAQDAATVQPAYVESYEHRMPDGSLRNSLQMAKEQMTQDTAFWAARQVDIINARLAAAGL